MNIRRVIIQFQTRHNLSVVDMIEGRIALIAMFFLAEREEKKSIRK
jgi:hypothetical protein